MEQTLGISGERLDLWPRKHHKGLKELWPRKCHFVAKEMTEIGSLDRQRPSGQETERDKWENAEAYTYSRIQTRKCFTQIRQWYIIVFISCNSFKVSLGSLKAIPVGLEQTKEMCYDDSPLIFYVTNVKSYLGNYRWHSWQNQMFQGNQFPVQGKCSTNAHEGPFPWKYVSFKFWWCKIILKSDTYVHFLSRAMDGWGY